MSRQKNWAYAKVQIFTSKDQLAEAIPAAFLYSNITTSTASKQLHPTPTIYFSAAISGLRAQHQDKRPQAGKSCKTDYPVSKPIRQSNRNLKL
jgi:hypothetical protein